MKIVDYLADKCGAKVYLENDANACALAAISLPSQSAILSAYINDVDPDMMYAQLVYGYANENDLVVGISTSGNSKKIVNALKVANAVGAKTLALTGMSGGALAEIADVLIDVLEHVTYKVQEYHLPVYHYLCAEVEKHFLSNKSEHNVN